ncbi:putative dinucleotide-binding enzyme [Arthrobacter sp. V4I6]|nr:putative dinucleotide-binding enzyme [Arthrobacter sp. V1I7]MDQ0854984.1 putative dinucleotide-binding enzyme [Arthrobacter sp. V4I6]
MIGAGVLGSALARELPGTGTHEIIVRHARLHS